MLAQVDADPVSIARQQPMSGLCFDRPCLVMGSAPGIDVERWKDFEGTTIGANAGMGILWRKLGLSTHIAVTTSYLFRPGVSVQELATRDMMADTNCVTMWLDNRDDRLYRARDVMQRRLRIEWGRLQVLNGFDRDSVQFSALGYKSRISTGVWAVCLALAAGAREVYVDGVSLEPGHWGQEWDDQPRDHVAEDRQAIKDLQAKGVEFCSL